MTSVQTRPPASEAGGRRRPRRRPVRRVFVVTHRWLALVLGLLLLVEIASGVGLLYRIEIDKALNADAWHGSGGPTRTSMGQAQATVHRAHPDYAATAVVRAHGVYAVTDYETAYTVDPTTGRILGHVGTPPSWLGFLANVHECAFTCEDYPGYWSAMNKKVPGTAWLSLADDGTGLTVGGLALGVLGLLLLYLSLTGLWLWFPRPRRWRAALTVRWRRGAYARDLDLHKVLGMLTLVPLLVWAVTGAGFYLKPMKQAWYAALPGSEVAASAPPTGRPAAGAPELTMDQAVARAEAARPGTHAVTVSIPAPKDTKTPYDVWLSSAHDPYALTDYPGDIELAVDQHTGATTEEYGFSGQPRTQTLWDAWSYPVHSGFVVNGWWRILWLVFGLVPLWLGWTGFSTWFMRLRRKRDRRRRVAERLQSSASGKVG